MGLNFIVAYFRVYPTGNFHFKTSLEHFPFLNSLIYKKDLTACLFKDDEISYVCHSRKSKEEKENVREYWAQLGRITNGMVFPYLFQFSLTNLNFCL
jgi:hypothetical protein